MKVIPTNIQLERYGIKDSNLCTFCKIEKETLQHLFVDCAKVKVFWEKVSTLILGFSQTLNFKNIILNTMHVNQKVIDNFIVLAAKHFIYKTRCLSENLIVTNYNFSCFNSVPVLN